MSRTAGEPVHQTTVATIFHEEPHTDIPLRTLVKMTGLEPVQVQRAITHLRSKPEYHDTLLIVLRAAVWRYEPTAPQLKSVPTPAKGNPHMAMPDMFETVGRAKDKSIIVRDADGNLYSVRPL